MNHTSNFDPYVFFVIAPIKRIMKTRTLYKASLTKYPFIGGIYTRVGNFPVHFISEDYNEFHVDKAKQALVRADIDDFLSRDDNTSGNEGNLALFPEGAKNHEPETLLPFRYGTFDIIRTHKLDVYYLLSRGCERAWPPTAPHGGCYVDIKVHIGRCAISKEVLQRHNVDVDKYKMSPSDFDKQLSITARNQMQAVYTTMVEDEKAHSKV